MAHQSFVRDNMRPKPSKAEIFRSPVGLGVVLLSVTAPIHLLADNETSITIAAMTLALIGGAYIGFAVADGRPKVFWYELAVATLFGAVAVALVFSILEPVSMRSFESFQLLGEGLFRKALGVGQIASCVVTATQETACEKAGAFQALTTLNGAINLVSALACAAVTLPPLGVIETDAFGVTPR